EMLMDGHTKTPDTEMAETDDLKQVLDLLEKMDKREATVLRMRFGLDGGEQKTLKEIGEALNLTRERVRQIESEALSKLSESMQAEGAPAKPQRGLAPHPPAPLAFPRPRAKPRLGPAGLPPAQPFSSSPPAPAGDNQEVIPPSPTHPAKRPHMIRRS